MHCTDWNAGNDYLRYKINRLRFQLSEYAVLDLMLFTDQSLKAVDVLPFLGKLFIISVLLSNRNVFHRRFEVLACFS